MNLNDEWRVRATLETDRRADEIARRLRGGELRHELATGAGERVVVTVDHHDVFLYASTRSQAQAASDAIWELAKDDEKPVELELRSITKRYTGVVANDAIDLSVHRGEVHAIVGENGAGKSTLMSILYGQVTPDDGEILVRGENVTSGYYQAGPEAQSPDAKAPGGVYDEEGWFHTGDIGGLDEQGRLFIRGRKKEMIVKPEGLNVFPEDVERVLDVLPGVRESAVVGIAGGAQERVHAVLGIEDGVEPDSIVRAANARLGDHQRITTLAELEGLARAILARDTGVSPVLESLARAGCPCHGRRVRLESTFPVHPPRDRPREIRDG